MPPNTSTPGSFEETMAKEQVYQQAVTEATRVPSADVLWQNRLNAFGVLGKYATDSRKRLIALLGEKAYNELIGEKTERLTPEMITNVVGRMVETNHGVHSLLENVFKDPSDTDITLGRRTAKLSTLVKDPKSADARMLAWYIENVATKSPAEKAAAFNHITNDAEAKTLSALMKARKMYDELSKDEENFDIGQTTPAGAAAIVSPGSQIGEVETRHKAAQRKIDEANRLMSAALAAKPDANVAGFMSQIDRAEEAQAKLDSEKAGLEKKRKSVKSKLDEFEAAMKEVDPGFTMNTTDRAAELNKSDLLSDLRSASAAVTFAGGTSRAAHEYFTDDTLRKQADGLAATLARSGKQKPLAGEVLNRLMEIEHDATLKSMPPEQRAAFLQNLRTTLSATAPGQSAESSDAAEAADEDAAEAAKKGSWLGWVSGVAGGVGSYLMERDKTLLGFKANDGKK